MKEVLEVSMFDIPAYEGVMHQILQDGSEFQDDWQITPRLRPMSFLRTDYATSQHPIPEPHLFDSISQNWHPHLHVLD